MSDEVGSAAGRTVAPRILVADDDALIRLVVRRTLEREGYEVVDAQDVSSAAEAARTGIALAVLDAHMPGEHSRRRSPGCERQRATTPPSSCSAETGSLHRKSRDPRRRFSRSPQAFLSYSRQWTRCFDCPEHGTDAAGAVSGILTLDAGHIGEYS